jgi:hypothetical protein
MKTIKNFKLLFTIILGLSLASSCKKESLKTDPAEIQTEQFVNEPEDNDDESAARNGEAVTKFPTIATNITSTQLSMSLWDGLTGATQVGGGAATATLSTNGLCNSNTQCFRSAKLQATGFGFDIPEGATIDNIKVKVYCKASVGNSIKDLSVQLANWSNVVETPINRAKNIFWGTGYSLRIYAGPISTWGLQSWTIYDFNALAFGLRISCKNLNTSSSAIASIDYVKITIRYTVGTSRQSQTREVNVSE